MRRQQLWLLLLVSLLICFKSQIAFSQTDFWQPTNGPYGGFVRSLVINLEGHIFAGTAGNGVLRSTDHGKNWKAINTGLPGRNVVSLTINTNGHLFAIGLDYGGVYRSIDNGETWTSVGPSWLFVYAICFNKQGHIFISTIRGIYKSTDDAQTWQETNFKADGAKLLVASNGYLFAAVRGYFLYSSDQGASWIQTQSPVTPIQEITALIQNNEGHLFAATYDGIFRSKNQGETWEAVNNGLTNKHVVCLISDSANNLLAGTSSSVFRSSDSGDNWLKLGLTGAYILAISHDSTGNLFASGNLNGIYRSTNHGVTWELARVSLSSANWIWSLIIHPNGDAFAGTYHNGLFRSRDKGETWSNVGLSNHWIFSLTVTPQGNIFAGSPQYGIFRSTDLGQNWQQVNKGLGNTNVYSLAADSMGTIFAGTERGLFRSKDNGETWEDVHPNFKILCLLPISTKRIFAGSSSWGLRQSLDGGNSWGILDIGLYRATTFISYNEILALAKSPAEHYFVGVADEGVFRSLDQGRTWLKGNPGLGGGPIYAFTADSYDHIFAATGGGVYITRNSGETWTELNEGLTNKAVRVLATSPENYIFVGTTTGVFRSTEPTNIKTIVNNAANNSLASFSLKQNYPNPFNPTTMIEFSLPRSGYVTLKIYNLLGEEIAALVAGNRTAGKHRIEWNPKDLPSGVYLYRLQTGELTATKKLMIIR